MENVYLLYMHSAVDFLRFYKFCLAIDHRQRTKPYLSRPLYHIDIKTHDRQIIASLKIPHLSACFGHEKH